MEVAAMSALLSEGAIEASPICGPLTREPVTVLVVDDSVFDRRLVGQLLESLKDVRLVYAGNALEALAMIERESPAVVLTDLVMPDIEGLELVQQVRARYPHISVILVTAYGSEEVAMQALRAGASNYIPKKRLARDLVPTLKHVLSVAAMTRERRRILRCMFRRESDFVLDNDPDLILPLLKLLHEEIEGLNLCDKGCQLQVGVALQEALYNALFHGNLEVSSDLRQEDERLFDNLIEERRVQEPYCMRRIHVQVRLDRELARFVVADEGPGFDTSIFENPVRPEDLNRIGGRGLLLIRTFMDQVSFNETGNQITLVKFRTPAQ
jgi:CheY-like chemotaxis protein